MTCTLPARRRTKAGLGAAGLMLAVATGLLTAPPAHAATLTLCQNPGPAPAIRHVLVMDLENKSYHQVIGSPSAPYINGTLTARCGVATNAFGATHASAANYLALSGGQYSAASTHGCGTVATCASTGPSLFGQLQSAGLGWRNDVEAATSSCQQRSISGVTKIGHDPGLFYNTGNCHADVVPVPSLTQSSATQFWNQLKAGTLPAFTWLSPTLTHVEHGSDPLPGQDSFVSKFLPQFVASASYQSGDTALIITYDEGNASDATTGENCASKTKDIAGQQESCHVPLWVVYPYNPGGSDATFMDAYSVTKGVEDMFSLPYIGHAGDAQTTSLAGHFGLAATR